MEPITFAFIFILGVGFGSELETTNGELNVLERQVNKLEETVFRLAGSHASLSAREKVNDDLQKKQIEYLLKEANKAPVAE